jgi:N-acetylglutamate synthase-like GNAT family acetyltransferase
VSRDGYEISDDDARLDRALIHRFLHDDSYWARGIPREIMDRAIDNSLCFGLYAGDGRQVGFARAITDRAAIAYLADVFVLERHRGRGLGKWLIETVLAHPDLHGLRRVFLGTADAHSLYERFGFRPLADPGRMMEIAVPYQMESTI